MIEYRVLQGKRKVYEYGRYNNINDAKARLLSLQLDGKRGLYISKIKIIKYNDKYNQLITL